MFPRCFCDQSASIEERMQCQSISHGYPVVHCLCMPCKHVLKVEHAIRASRLSSFRMMGIIMWSRCIQQQTCIPQQAVAYHSRMQTEAAGTYCIIGIKKQT